MCELIVCRSKHPFRLGRVLTWAENLESWGDAGYGWGISWREPDADALLHYRQPTALAEDRAYERVGDRWATEALLHLRMPSDFTTIGVPDTQPLTHPDGFAFAHNGYFPNHHTIRLRLEAQGRSKPHLKADMRGRADSEVGMWVMAAAMRLLGENPREAAASMHQVMGGNKANIVALFPDGRLVAYASNVSNGLYRLRHLDMDVVTTGMHAADARLVRYLFPGDRVKAMDLGESLLWSPGDFQDVTTVTRGARKHKPAKKVKLPTVTSLARVASK